jgi:hypothetical protein
MECKDNGVSGFRTDQGFEHGSGRRVRDRGNSGNDADRFSYLDIPFQIVFFNNTHCLLIFYTVIDILGGKDVLDDLVLEQTSFCFLHSKLCQIHVLIQSGKGHGMDDFVHLFLSQLHILSECLLCICHQFVHHSIGINRYGFWYIFGFLLDNLFIFLFHVGSSLYLKFKMIDNSLTLTATGLDRNYLF